MAKPASPGNRLIRRAYLERVSSIGDLPVQLAKAAP